MIMIKRLVTLFLFCFLFSENSLLILYPDANFSNTKKLNVSDVDAIYFLFQEVFLSNQPCAYDPLEQAAQTYHQELSWRLRQNE